MTRVLVQRGSSGGGSSSNPNRSGGGGGSSSNSSVRAEPQVPVLPENSDEVVGFYGGVEWGWGGDGRIS